MKLYALSIVMVTACGVAPTLELAGDGAALVPGRSNVPQYRGYWGSAMDGVGTGNYIAATAAQGANVAFVREADPTRLRAKVEEARAHGMQVLLYIETVAFPWASSKLYDDYQARLAAHVAPLAGLMDSVAGFYIFDEPYHKNKVASWDKVPNATLKDSMNVVASFVKTTYPGKLTLASFTTFEIDDAAFAGELNPQTVDVIGVNCQIAAGCSDDAYARAVFGRLLERKAPGQRVLMTADGWTPAPSVDVDARLTARMDLWTGLAADTASVAVFLPFLYQTHVADEPLHGLNELPSTLGRVSIYFDALKGQLSCVGDDLVRRDGSGAEAGRWSSAPMCIPRCEGKDYTRRDANRVVLEVWPNAPVC